MRRGLQAGMLTALVACGSAEPPASAPSIRFASTEAPEFARVIEPPTIALPKDHGPHFGHQTEWWYFTGQLDAADGRSFGYQLTFFRRGLSPGPPPEGGGLATNQFYFAHFALTDVGARTHRFAERRSRGSHELAGARQSPFRVWLDGWEAAGFDAAAEGNVRLRASLPGQDLDLTLAPSKPLVLHGDHGLSPKSEARGNASAYVGHTRMKTAGTLTASGTRLAVTGESWFDHEWSTSALGPDAVGWDWFSLQLDDSRELMLFQIRLGGGGIEPASSGTLVEADGSTRRIAAEDFELEVLSHWTSPDSGARYPSGWRLRVPAHGLDLTLEPRVAAQEMRTSFTYWEGAVEVSGRAGDRVVAGRGYVELTGYARTMQGVF